MFSKQENYLLKNQANPFVLDLDREDGNESNSSDPPTSFEPKNKTQYYSKLLNGALAFKPI